MTKIFFIACGALNLFLAVSAGAFGAHGLKKMLDVSMLAIWQTGVTYHLVHGLGLMMTGCMLQFLPAKNLRLAGIFMLVGILLFCGSLYLLALTGKHPLGIITPVGGVAFLLAWLIITVTAWHDGKTLNRHDRTEALPSHHAMHRSVFLS